MVAKYEVINGAFYLWNDGDNNFSRYLCREVRIEKIMIDIVKQNQTLQISFEALGGMVQKIIPRVHFTNNGLLKILVEHGLDITDVDINILKQILVDRERYAEIIYTHDRLGFIEEFPNGFFLDTSININGVSKYLGQQCAESQGSREEWIQMINDKVCGNIQLEVAMSIGFSAPILYLLNEYSNTDTLIASLVGRTSTGKSSTLFLLASIWGKPDFSKNGLISSFNSTITAQMKHLSNKSGFPIFIDESTSLGNHHDWSKYIYDISTGLEKERCDSNSNLKERMNWLTTVIITSERSMLDESNNDGVKIRLLEFPLSFFNNAESADYVKSTVKRSYGHAGRMFVEYLLTLGVEELYQKYDMAVKVLREKLSNQDSPRIRMIRKLAIFIVTAEIINAADIGFQLHLEDIKNVLIDIEEKACCNREDIADEAFEFLKNKICENFFKLQDTNRESNGNIGKLFRNNNGKIENVWILSSVVKKFFHRTKYEEQLNNIFDNWINTGKLIMVEKEKNGKYIRKDCKRNLLGISQRVQIFKIDIDEKLELKLKETM